MSPVEDDRKKSSLVESSMSSLEGLVDEPQSGASLSRGSSGGVTPGSLGSSNSGSCLRRGRLSPGPAAGRVSLTKLCEEKKAKRCRFYRNGDQWFPGAIVAVGGDKYRTWEALLGDLTRILDHPLHLIAGVRYVFSLEGVKIISLDQLEQGGEYVASSTDSFKMIDYRKARLPQWRVQARRKEALHVNQLFQSPLGTPATTPGTERACSPVTASGYEPRKDFIRPKLITVIRNGVRPRKAVRILLNRRTARSFEQVLNDITDAIKLDSGAVRKVFTLDGHQVTTLKDFFIVDDIFIAYGPERHYHDDFDLDSEECRTIQPLLKSNSSPRHIRRLPSPKPRGRAVSPLTVFDGPGSLPRLPRKSRGSSPGKRQSRLLVPTANGHVSCDSLENILHPVEVHSMYRIGGMLGDGNFAVVKKCTMRSTGEEFALKIIDKARCRGKEHMIESEVSILRRISHPNIVKLFKEFDHEDYLYLVMELVKGGDLFDAIASATRFTEEDASSMIRDLCSALHYLHQRNIVHRDIKPENLLVVEENGCKNLKLGDFGLAVEVVEPLYTVCGTPTYVAPEILAETGYGLKVDIWAAGVITYILLCGFPPFVSATNNQEELFDQILKGHYEFHSPYWDKVSNLARELIVNMIQVDQERRFTASQVLLHSWVMNDRSLKNSGAECQDICMPSHVDSKKNVQVTSVSSIMAESAPCLNSLEVL